MTLEQFLKINDLSPENFGKLINVTGQAVRYWLAKERHPAPKHIRAIQNATDNKVKPESWF